MPDSLPPQATGPAVAGAAQEIAAVDLGSNSFHMIVGRVAQEQLQVVDRLREMVRLGEGLTEDRGLSPEVQERALACLGRFGQRLRGLPPGGVRAVGTNTLRQVRPDCDFLSRAEQALGHPIEVIAGREEARLVYLGVAHGLAAGDEQRLVVDIGGGSTEVIIGRRFTPSLRESLEMGCVTMTGRHFPDGRITAKAMERAELSGGLEIRPVREQFRKVGWQKAVGSSGTIRAIREVVRAEGWCDDGISATALERLAKALPDFGRVADIDLKGLSAERRPVFPGGVAVLRAVFKHLRVGQMQVSDQALREGLLYEMLGRTHKGDLRDHTVQSMMRRYHVDAAHAHRVEVTAAALYRQVAGPWGIDNPQYRAMLGWAARLHEVGLSVSHSQYQKHGAYLVRNADMSGFSLREQAVLAALVRGHRRRLPVEDIAALAREIQECTRRLCVLLRLAVLVHRGRSGGAKPRLVLEAAGSELRLAFPARWLDTHPLTRTELEEEAERLRAAGMRLTVI